MCVCIYVHTHTHVFSLYVIDTEVSCLYLYVIWSSTFFLLLSKKHSKEKIWSSTFFLLLSKKHSKEQIWSSTFFLLLSKEQIACMCISVEVYMTCMCACDKKG